ncbi:MAG TPA: NUDIX domain-containing protein [Bacteroidia bacterium]|jgi:predicted NUDIX family NTP pyrophosphohydrolase
MSKQSAGILLFRRTKSLEVLLVHPGGPFWKNKDEGAWSIPKGEFELNEDLLEAAKREFREETGKDVNGEFITLEPVKLKSGKIVHAFALEGELDEKTTSSNEFEMEWPPRSGKKAFFPEVDKAGWFDIPAARKKINPAQVLLLDQLENKLLRE